MDRNGGTVVEQNDQVFADVNEGNFVVGDCRQIQLGGLIEAKLHFNGLAIRWFDDMDDPRFECAAELAA